MGHLAREILNPVGKEFLHRDNRLSTAYVNWEIPLEQFENKWKGAA
jgi:hypothetical protein